MWSRELVLHEVEINLGLSIPYKLSFYSSGFFYLKKSPQVFIAKHFVSLVFLSHHFGCLSVIHVYVMFINSYLKHN